MKDKLTKIDVILNQVDSMWTHKWESFKVTFEDITSQEANYQMEAYKDEPHEAEWPLPGTIFWHVSHLAFLHNKWVEQIKNRHRQSEAEAMIRKPADTFEDELKYLICVYDDFRATIALLSGDELLERVPPEGYFLYETINNNIRHLIWHIAQIKMIRQIYNNRCEIKE